MAPTATLSLKTANVLLISFSETMVSLANSTFALSLNSSIGTALIESMEVTMTGTTETCPLTWTLSSSFVAGSQFDGLKIVAEVECSLSEKKEKFFVKFKAPALLTDLGRNELATPLISCYSKRYKYISSSSKAVVDGSGSAFNSASFLTLALALGLALFQSSAVGSFWAFVNMLQIISYLPIIDCVIPYNFEIFLTEYLTVSKLVFPFAALTDYIPNPLSYLSQFITNPLNERYLLCGYESLSFLYNFGDQLFTWLLLALVYAILRILVWVFPRPKCEFIHKWREEYEYNTLLRALVECYLNMTFCAFLDICQVFQLRP